MTIIGAILSLVNWSLQKHCRTVEKIKIGAVFVDFVDFVTFCYQLSQCDDQDFILRHEHQMQTSNMWVCNEGSLF